ncbi:MAG: rhodanese-like domain-containing protein [Candidatus Cloacimonetes bacterium]|nr:rhodanese-like domain-containing protein [Candidatus Cloacimonadota bacterium]
MIHDNANSPDFVIIDVRSEREFFEDHIENAVLIPSNLPDLEKELLKLDKNKTYLLYCLFGGRSSSLLREMKNMGFEKIDSSLHFIPLKNDRGFLNYCHSE